MLAQINALLFNMRFWDVLDILIVAYVMYYLYSMIKDTKAATLLKGLIVLGFFTLLSSWFDFYVVNWLLQKIMAMVLIALPIVFQPELRKTLERIGRGKLFRKNNLAKEKADQAIEEIVGAAVSMARHKVGALIVLEQQTGLSDYIETGTLIEASISQELLMTIFAHNTPLHDGAVIIREGKLMAAGCLLPLTEDRTLSRELGTRHRAAIGMSEQTDAWIIVVSEESGTISIAHEGKLQRFLTGAQLKVIINGVMGEEKLTWQDIIKELVSGIRGKWR